MKNINILIVDDHEIIHNGIEDILKKEENLSIVGHAYNGKEALDLVEVLLPDVIFMDISMPEMNGIEACKRLKEKFSNIKIIALTQHESKEYVQHFLSEGGNGYLLKNSKKEEFLAAIDSVMKGNQYINSELAANMLSSFIKKAADANSEKNIHLTRREIEIIKKIAEDKSNNEIANELFISLRTVETHRRNIMQKIEAKSVVSLLKYASKHNIIDL